MNRFITFIIAIVLGINLSAQTIVNNRPSWITKIPVAKKNAAYYYRVTSAEARTYQEAYSKAFATAILESAWKLGVAVDVNSNAESLQQNISQAINVDNRQMRIPLNKVCEHSEAASSMNVRIFVLWQVAKYGNVDPDFDDYCNCQ